MSDLRDITWDDTTTTIDIGGVKLVMTRETGADLALRLAAIYHHENVINAAITGRREVAGRMIERLDRIVDYLKRDYMEREKK